ncbi:MAG: hypothetical protein JO099_01650 [Acidobacteriia bacterium]|nr:hypothetical protein [Terriglobia bacterium]
MKPMKQTPLALLLTGIVLCAAPALAHHSLAATYLDKEVKLEGKIIDLLLRNPHSFLQIEAPDENGVSQRWSLEWRSSGQLGAQGIKRDTLKVGDEIIITMNPSRTPGDHRGALKTLHRKSDGFGWGNNPGETTE